MFLFLLKFVSERQSESLHNFVVHIAGLRIARPHCKMASYYFYNAPKGYITIKLIAKKVVACSCHKKYHFFHEYVPYREVSQVTKFKIKRKV